MRALSSLRHAHGPMVNKYLLLNDKNGITPGGPAREAGSEEHERSATTRRRARDPRWSPRAAIDHPHRLALAARDLIAIDDPDRDRDAGLLMELVGQPRAQLVVVDAVARRLADQGQLVERARPLHDQLVVRRQARDAEHDALDLRRVQVDAADDQHV